MPTHRVLSLYCTEADLAVWKAYAGSRGMGVGPALKELIRAGLEAHMNRAVEDRIQGATDTLIQFTVEAVAGVRLLLINADKDRGLYSRARENARKMWEEFRSQQ